MGEYRYQALDKGGKEVQGIIEASNEQFIIEKLQDMGYYPLRVVPGKRSLASLDLSALPPLRYFFHRIRFKHIVTFTRQLATLIDAGLPIVRSLYILQEQTESAIFRKKIGNMIEDVEAGASLSEALSRHPRIFDKLYVNMARAGEIGGALENVLLKIAGFQENRQALKSKVRSAMMYPTVVMLIAGAIVTYILIDIIPRFEAIFSMLGEDLPFPTQMLVHASNILIHQGVWVLMGIIALFLMARKIAGTRTGKFLFDGLKLKMPAVGELFRKIAIARFATTLSTLINSGVPILQALDIVRDTSGNEMVSRAVEKVYTSVKEGETIHVPLSTSKVFPPMVVHMVAVGEETGAIDHMLTKVAEAYEREVNDTVNALTSVLEPLLIVCLGVLIGVIVVALYLPYFMLPTYLGR